MTLKSSATTNDERIAVAVSHLTVRLGETNVVDDVSFEVARGAVAAIIGPNGAGKTTLLKAILGLIPAASGTAAIFGLKIDEVRARVAYVPQRFDFDRSFPLTVTEFMALRCPNCSVKEAEKALKEVGLMPAILDKRLGDLSGGQLQRALIAQAIIHEPQVLFLDEPASGIDIVGEAAFYGVLEHLKQEHGTTIMLVSHDLSVLANFVDVVICLNHDLVCYGPPSEAITHSTLNKLFGSRAHLFDHLTVEHRQHHPAENEHHGHDTH
jgi:ABC-type Mn2+/Zn2+ transport system ATPase subunit